MHPCPCNFWQLQNSKACEPTRAASLKIPPLYKGARSHCEYNLVEELEFAGLFKFCTMLTMIATTKWPECYDFKADMCLVCRFELMLNKRTHASFKHRMRDHACETSLQKHAGERNESQQPVCRGSVNRRYTQMQDLIGNTLWQDNSCLLGCSSCDESYAIDKTRT
jgi:hypothetical protein